MVELRLHFHDGDSGFGLSMFDGALNRSGASILREQGCVDIDESVRWNAQQSVGETPSAGNDHSGVRRVSANLIQKLLLPDLRRLQNRHFVLVSHPDNTR